MALDPGLYVAPHKKPHPLREAPLQSKRTLLDKLWLCPARLDIRRNWLPLFFLVAGILFCRLWGAFLDSSFYAEDGIIFFKQNYEQGFFSALFTHYAGYLHFTPRIVAGICGILPLEYVPVAYATASLFLAAAVFTFFFAPGFRRVVDSDSLRACIVVIWTLMPNADSLMKLAYVNWYMLVFIALTTLFTLPQRPFVRWLLFLLVSVAAWSTPAGIVCLPVMALRAWETPDRKERFWWVALALMVISYSLTAHSPSPVTMLLHETDWIWALIHATGYRVFCFFAFGNALCHPERYEGWNFVTGVSLLLAGICAGGVVSAMARTQERGSARRIPLVLFYLILGLPALFVLRQASWSFFLKWDYHSWYGNGRYFYSSTLLLCVLCGVVYERVLRDWIIVSAQRRGFVTLLLLGWLNLHQLDFKLEDWPTKHSWRNYAREIRAAETRTQLTGGSETVHVKTFVGEMDFDLHVNPAPANRSRASASPN